MEFRILIAILFLGIAVSCEKEIEIDVPLDPGQIVVEGQIENDAPPLLLLSRSQAFFAPVNIEEVASTLITDAQVTMIVDQQDTIPLIPLCADQIPDSLREQFANESGLVLLNAENANFCLFTSLDPAAIGKVGSSYQIEIQSGEERLTSTTRIPQPVPLDSLWYKKDGSRDSLGFAWARLSDPGGQYNAYRWFAQRISVYKNGPNKGEVKDPFFVAPFGSAVEDDFFDGLEFDLAYNRGSVSGSEKIDDNSIESGYFKEGDTILVKWASIDRGVFEYFRSYYNALGNTGSPFATPTNIKTNVQGGLGIWAGYGSFVDTLIAVDIEP